MCPQDSLCYVVSGFHIFIILNIFVCFCFFTDCREMFYRVTVFILENGKTLMCFSPRNCSLSNWVDIMITSQSVVPCAVACSDCSWWYLPSQCLGFVPTIAVGLSLLFYGGQVALCNLDRSCIWCTFGCYFHLMYFRLLLMYKLFFLLSEEILKFRH